MEQQQLLEAILQELKTITAELQLLRSEFQRLALPKTNKTIPAIASSRAGDASNPAETDSAIVPSRAGDASNPAETDSALLVCDWLSTRGITVKNYREQQAADQVFDQLAIHLGERFNNLGRVLDAIKRSLSNGSSFTLNLSACRQEEINDSTQFCMMLNTYAFLSSYWYNKTTRTIHATPQRVGEVINFFTGGWFERYVYLSLIALFSQNNLEHACLLNPQVTFANGDYFEFDLLWLVNGQPLWVECKTGDYQAYVAKYSAIRKLLSVPKKRSILIILDIPNELALHLTRLYDITVANETNFLERVSEAVGLAGPV